MAALVAILGTDSAEVERRLVVATACSPGLARHGRRLLLADIGVLALGLVAAAQIGSGSVAADAVPGATPRPIVSVEVAGSAFDAAGPARAAAVPTTQAGATVEEDAGAADGSAATTIPTAPAGAEATVTIASVGIRLPVVLGGQSVIDQGLVAHYTAPGWEDPVPAGAPGTYWLAAHATTHGAPFATLPEIAVGAEIRLDAGGRTFVYTVTSTQVTGLYPGDDLMYGTDPSAPVILLQTCIDSSRRLLVHGTLTASL